MTQPTDELSRRQRLAAGWSRFWAALRGPDEESGPDLPPEPPGRLIERRPITPITVPARGFAFTFEVHGSFVWTSDGLERDTLRALVDRFLPYAQQYLRNVATGLARGVEPHRGEDFERRLRNKIRARGDWMYEQDGEQVTCRAHVRIDLDERVQQHIRPFWEQMISLDLQRDLAARRARHADGVSSQWATVLERLLSGPVPDGAARMTDEHLAAVVRDLLVERAGDGRQGEYEREGFFDLMEERRRRQTPA